MLKTLIFASALSLFMAGNAAASAAPWSATISIAGTDYDVSLLSGTWPEHSELLMLSPWWGCVPCAVDAAADSNDAGAPYAALFAVEEVDFFGGAEAVTMDGFLTLVSGSGGMSWAYAQPSPVTAVPVPAAGWLFMSALIGLMGKKRLSRRSVH
jgi:hypothetical protein